MQIYEILSKFCVPQNKDDWWTDQAAFTVIILIMALGVMHFWLISRLLSKSFKPEGILKVFGCILIIFAICFITIVSWQEDQVSPSIGLLATIAGYLLGKTQTDEGG